MGKYSVTKDFISKYYFKIQAALESQKKLKFKREWKTAAVKEVVALAKAELDYKPEAQDSAVWVSVKRKFMRS
jgi:hypothetical protein